ncbi:elongation factor 1-beta-like [Diadema setosum]|uniref:elongation factor 1-beta-like n=1 Tax=Diadema setosum TaxID=31175 RepID=UPI003B3AC274
MTKMGFGDLKNASGQAALNQFLVDRSYIEGYTPSQADVVVFKAMSGAPKAELFNALRWYNQIKSYSSQFDSLPGVKKALGEYGPSGTAAPAAKDDDSDDFDCFGSDDSDDDDSTPVKIVAKKPAKVVIQKSSILFDVKPCDDETKLSDIEKAVRAIEKDGLKWGASKSVPICYGIEKLQILCTVEDAKVSVQDLEDEIEEMEIVQSVDIAAFNKI